MSPIALTHISLLIAIIAAPVITILTHYKPVMLDGMNAPIITIAAIRIMAAGMIAFAHARLMPVIGIALAFYGITAVLFIAEDAHRHTPLPLRLISQTEATTTIIFMLTMILTTIISLRAYLDFTETRKTSSFRHDKY